MSGVKEDYKILNEKFLENLGKTLKYKKLECYESHKTNPELYLKCATGLNKIMEDNKIAFAVLQSFMKQQVDTWRVIYRDDNVVFQKYKDSVKPKMIEIIEKLDQFDVEMKN